MAAMTSDIQWSQKHRPRKIEDCVLPSSISLTLTKMIESGEVPSMIFSGTTGVGKTTAALAICDTLGVDYLLLNGSGEDRGIASVNGKISRFATSVSMDGGRKCVIVDEADNMTVDAQLALRSVMEQVSSNCSFIFTCNYVAKLEKAIRSRCVEIEFVVPNDEASKLQFAMFKRALTILDQHGVKYDKKIVSELIVGGFPDFRQTLNVLQKASLAGTIDESSVKKAKSGNSEGVVSVIASKSARSINEFAASIRVDQSTIAEIGRWIDENKDVFADDESWANAIVIANDHDDRASRVVDHTINLKAFLLKLCKSCKVKK